MTPDQIDKLIAPKLSKRLGATGPWRITGPEIKTEKSEIFIACNDVVPIKACVKIYHEGRYRPRKLRLEYQLLGKIHKCLAAFEDYDVARPLLVLPDQNLIMTEWVDGPPLSEILWPASTSPEMRLSCIDKAARWLRHFHDAKGADLRSLDAAWYIDALGRQLGRSKFAYIWLSRDRVYQKALDKLEKSAFELSKYSVEYVRLHGDFSAQNLLYDTNRIVGIDLGRGRDAPAIEDMNKFLVGLNMRRPQRKPNHKDQLKVNETEADIFFGAYDRAGINRLAAPVLYLELYEILRRWIVITKQIGSRQLSPIRIRRYLALRRLAKTAIFSLETAIAAGNVHLPARPGSS